METKAYRNKEIYKLGNTPIAGTEKIIVGGSLLEAGIDKDYTIDGDTIVLKMPRFEPLIISTDGNVGFSCSNPMQELIIDRSKNGN